MKTKLLLSVLLAFSFTLVPRTWAQSEKATSINILAIGGHPDDCDIRAAGLIKKIEAQGHKAKFVALTNGDKGHWRDSGETLAKRRQEEMKAAGDMLGVSMEILDNRDGELVASLKNREAVVRIIREWNTDLLIVHGANELHPDHRATHQLVVDAAMMFTVPNYLSEVTPLKQLPIILYGDNLYGRLPFNPEIILPVDDVIDDKLAVTLCHFSQFVEWGTTGNINTMPKTEEEIALAMENSKQGMGGWFSSNTNRYRDLIDKAFGKENSKSITYVEAFEVSPYGRLPSLKELKALFPEGTYFDSGLK